MSDYSFYHKDTGVLHNRRLVCDDVTHLKNNTPDDHVIIDGHHDHRNKRVDLESGTVVDHKPDAPTEQHAWNEEVKLWELPAHIHEARAARAEVQTAIAALVESQHHAVRRVLLGDKEALLDLKSIDDEITKLRLSLK